MNADEIIRKMANPEGFDIEQSVLADILIDNLGNCHVFQYGKIVFTVDKKTQMIHLYADCSGSDILRAGRLFMRDVWENTGFDFLTAVILNERVKKYASRFGWKPSKKLIRTGHQIYYVAR